MWNQARGPKQCCTIITKILSPSHKYKICNYPLWLISYERIYSGRKFRNSDLDQWKTGEHQDYRVEQKRYQHADRIAMDATVYVSRTAHAGLWLDQLFS